MQKNMQKKSSILVFMLALLMVAMCFSGCGKTSQSIYADASNWAYLQNDVQDKDADVFFICPTVYMGDENSANMSLTDEDTKANFLGATNMEKGIYDENCRFFAPYYQQVGLVVYQMQDSAEQEKYFEIAYNDVKESFEYYMQNYNNGRPIVLAGFSQGADMCIRLMKDEFANKKTSDLLVACFAPGWRLTDEEVAQYPQLKLATGENDTGVIITFNSEAENITQSMMVPEGTKTLAINPLNWQTDSTVADKALNNGACFTNYSGDITAEIPNLTGAYIDEVRGTLKVTDVTPEEYPPVLPIFEDGIYHLYDYQFFYRNLQENVNKRVQNFISK